MEKSRPMMIIIIALLVLLLGTIIAVTIYLISTFGGEAVEPEAPRTTPTPFILPSDIEWWELDEVRTNLLEGPPNRFGVYVVTTIMVGINTTGPRQELADLRVDFSYQRARTIANEVLFATTYAEAKTPEGRAAIEERILNRLQLEFGPLVVGVSTPDWAIS
jgi:flagellar basal body-associated protein FliL